ncbi:MAG: rod shape-determining protein MreC [Spirochaetales bacterium]|nr:rod shape-determining protein MreC [Spirochaetales bacterium]
MNKLNYTFFKHRKGYVFLVLLISSLIMLGISSRGFVKKPKEIGKSLFSYFDAGITGISNWFGETWNSISELKRVRDELASVQEKLLEYERLSRDIIELKQENAQLKELLKLSKSLKYKQIAAEVIGHDPVVPFSSIIINKGYKDGIKREMPVVAYKSGLKGLVGKIVLVNRHSSTILPLLDPSSYVAGRIQHNRYEGLLKGQGSGSPYLIMEYVKKAALDTTHYGDTVITSGLGGVYPKGIHIGRIRSIGSKSYETSMILKVEPIIDFGNIEYVFVLKKEDK